MGAFFLGGGSTGLEFGIPALIGWGESTRHPMASSYHIPENPSIQKLNWQNKF